MQGKEGEHSEVQFDVGSPTVGLLVKEDALNRGSYEGGHTNLIFELLELECRTQRDSVNDIAVRDDQHVSLSDPEDEDVSSALARQKHYNSDPESNQPSHKKDSKKNTDDKMTCVAYLMGLPNFCSNAAFEGIFRFGEEKLYISFIYAKCNSIEHRDLWQSLELVDSNESPWLMVGDFNIIREDSERVGGHPRPITSMEDFNNCIDHCGLLDLQVMGRRLSWCNGRERHTCSWARLDRALINIHFANRFPSAFFEYLNHCPMLIHFQKQETIKELEERLEVLESCLQGGYDKKVECDFLVTKFELDTWEQREELRLSQLEKKKWLSEGDQNTKFFHVVVNQRRKSKVISNMRLENGTILNSPEQVHQGALNYFQDYLSNPPIIEQVDLTSLIQNSIAEENNVALALAPAEAEILAALKSIPRESSPGLNGFGSVGAPLVSHLLYADDLLVFVNGGKRFVQRLLSTLERRNLMRLTGFVEGKFPVTYLAPLVSGRLTSRNLEPLTEKIRRKIAG
ncbi:hypothetical protein Patl1_12355 [Pistacia atlantica]|uniref:Uncharacterized protein n=1 Tax=Pistacia atlantica TaxID=434234 RepID=A0ACC1A478_9ROSI|nr:hypothetical protein Patl1_12355 [Pistacia atlantica]